MRDWQNRLKKLMALAADQAGTPEGEIAARLAQKIMDSRRVALQELDEEQRNAQDPFSRAPLDLGGKAFWRRRVASLVAQHCDCICSFVGHEGRLSGRRSSVLIAEYLYRVMSRSIVVEQTAWLGKHSLLEDRRAANDFAQSAVLALDSRLRSIREEQPMHPQTTALVRSDRAALRRWLSKRGVTLKKEIPFPFAYTQEGYEAGFRVPLQKAVTTD